MGITKIVITGGPCAGKTTAMSWIQNAFTARGYTVLFVPETATELIGGGVAPWTCGTNLDYQKCQVRLQAVKEELFEQAARTMKAENILIVCDRGMMDNRVYMNEEEFSEILRSLNTNIVQMRDQYDAIFHLVTAANGAVEFYTTQNNTARTETPEQAIALDNKLIAAWTGHPHLRVIGNETDFETKMKRLIEEISSFLGAPIPLEVERKFLIRRPQQEWLENLPNCQRVEIIQTYLTSEPGTERRVRQRGMQGSFTYYLTTKRPVSDVSRVEIEQRLTAEEYLHLLMEADTSMHSIRKSRYCLTSGGQYFEIDIFPFWADKAILEIELMNEDDPVTFPEGIEVLREVTDDPDYKNYALAKKAGAAGND